MNKLQKQADLLRRKAGKQAVKEYNDLNRAPASDRNMSTVVFIDKKHKREKYKKDLRNPENW